MFLKFMFLLLISEAYRRNVQKMAICIWEVSNLKFNFYVRKCEYSRGRAPVGKRQVVDMMS